MNKNSDTIIIYGGGSSLNDITESEYNHFKKFDSIAVNLFIKTKIHLTHYILGEGLLFLLHKIETETDNNLKSEYLNEYNNYIQIFNNDYSDTQIIFIGEYLIMEFLNKYIDIIKNDISNDMQAWYQKCLLSSHKGLATRIHQTSRNQGFSN